MLKRSVLAAVLVAIPLSLAGAQASSPTQALSLQPLNAVFGFYSAEYERAAGAAVTWGIGANYAGNSISGGDARYTSAEFKLRAYPSGVALNGFSIGGAVGYTSISAADGTSGGSSSVGGPTFGVLLEYQWLLGDKKEWTFALGGGAKALFISEDNSNNTVDFAAKYPTLRISFGYAWR